MQNHFMPCYETLEDRSVPAGLLPQDAGLAELVQARAADQLLDRGDLVAILRAAAADETVDATKFADLQTLIDDADAWHMPDPVRVLASKVVDGDPGNRWFQGSSLGNLSAGSSGGHLDTLIDKWFFGTDHPKADSAAGKVYSYRPAAGQLFVAGPSTWDIRQGRINDCYFLTALALTAQQTPATVSEMFTDNGDSTWTVLFYRDGTPDYVTVDRSLPVDGKGRLVFANSGAAAKAERTELWTALAEKAYVQWSQSGAVHGLPGSPSGYNFISFGRIADALHHVSGRASVFANSDIEQNTLAAELEADQLIGLASKWQPALSKIYPNHAYALTGYDEASGNFELFQPIAGTRYPRTISLTVKQLAANFASWDGTVGKAVAADDDVAWSDLAAPLADAKPAVPFQELDTFLAGRPAHQAVLAPEIRYTTAGEPKESTFSRPEGQDQGDDHEAWDSLGIAGFAGAAGLATTDEARLGGCAA